MTEAPAAVAHPAARHRKTMADRVLAPNRAPIGVELPYYGASVAKAATSGNPVDLGKVLLGGVSTLAGQGAAAAGNVGGSSGLAGWFKSIGIAGIAGIAGLALVILGIYSVVVPSKEFIIKQTT